MILTIHMKSGKQIAVWGANQDLLNWAESFHSVPGIAKLIKVRDNCNRIVVKGSTYAQLRTAQIIIKTQQVEFVQADVPTS